MNTCFALNKKSQEVLTKVFDCSDLAEICKVETRSKMNRYVCRGFTLGCVVLSKNDFLLNFHRSNLGYNLSSCVKPKELKENVKKKHLNKHFLTYNQNFFGFPSFWSLLTLIWVTIWPVLKSLS